MDARTIAGSPPGAGYWYDDEGDASAVAMLAAVRRLRHADHEMRRRISAGMDMNTTDLEALRHVIAHESVEDPLTLLRLARLLGISGASTTKLLDRLSRSGHLRRAPHPTDRRALVVRATDHAHEEVRDRLAVMHERMLEVAQQVPLHSRRAVAEFLDALAEHLDEQAAPDPLTPAPRR